MTSLKYDCCSYRPSLGQINIFNTVDVMLKREEGLKETVGNTERTESLTDQELRLSSRKIWRS